MINQVGTHCAMKFPFCLGRSSAKPRQKGHCADSHTQVSGPYRCKCTLPGLRELDLLERLLPSVRAVMLS